MAFSRVCTPLSAVSPDVVHCSPVQVTVLILTELIDQK